MRKVENEVSAIFLSFLKDKWVKLAEEGLDNAYKRCIDSFAKVNSVRFESFHSLIETG